MTTAHGALHIGSAQSCAPIAHRFAASAAHVQMLLVSTCMSTWRAQCEFRVQVVGSKLYGKPPWPRNTHPSCVQSGRDASPKWHHHRHRHPLGLLHYHLSGYHGCQQLQVFLPPRSPRSASQHCLSISRVVWTLTPPCFHHPHLPSLCICISCASSNIPCAHSGREGAAGGWSQHIRKRIAGGRVARPSP